MKANGYVVSYVNPDTDGVCTSIAYSYFKRLAENELYLPIFFGRLQPETIFVLDHFGIEAPQRMMPEEIIRLAAAPVVVVDNLFGHQKFQ